LEPFGRRGHLYQLETGYRASGIRTPNLVLFPTNQSVDYTFDVVGEEVIDEGRASQNGAQEKRS
jgi:hypothetical protein